MHSLIRRLILAAALMAGLVPVMAQVPPPVPGLPDTERRTTYSISGTTCICAVNFALYGDSTDYQNWVEVFVNGVLMPQSGNWTITSPTGPLATIPRPITDAVLTFNSVKTGTVQIVGARRPRRVSQFNENTGVSARNLNQALTDMVAMLREDWDKINDVTGRAILAAPGETLALLPAAANRKNQGACWDTNGNLINCVSIPSSTFSAGANITFTGTNPTVVAAVIPPPSVSTLGGVQSKDCSSSNQAVQKINVDGSITCATKLVVPVAPNHCTIISTSATSCNNGGSVNANNGVYTPTSGIAYFKVRLTGGGSGGSGSGTGLTAGGAGGNTTFNSTTTAPGASAPTTVIGAVGGVQGANCDFTVAGQDGQSSDVTISTPPGTAGGSSFWGGGGAPGAPGIIGGAAKANTGSGGGGGGAASSVAGAASGGAGAYCERTFSGTLSATYSYAIGAGGSGGSGASAAGGAGASGNIQIDEFYN